MEVIIQQIYVPNCNEGGWYTCQRSQTVSRKTFHAIIEPPCSLYSSNLVGRIHGFMDLTPNIGILSSQAPIGVKLLESRHITPCYSFPIFYTTVFCALLPRQDVRCDG
ncbi:hypothetical protein TNCV_2073641 [Trichonephila clavipes]|nr:hypothetical protein TNCV_2073641 [Trichonephila clavipes]